MTDTKTLVSDLQKLVKDLEADLLERATGVEEIDRELRGAYEAVRKAERTGAAFETWREEYLTQVAVAWVLGCVFVRYLEDNELIDEVWIAGEGDRRRMADDQHDLYFRQHPELSDREYLLHVFNRMQEIPAVRDLFAEGKTPLWALGPSADGAKHLLDFWQDVEPETGHQRRSFANPEGDTRFLGDLYQDLSEAAQKKYALKQTPEFIEEFILDRALTPAIDEFGLEEVRMIDPACGSGHFLLGAFHRLLDLWMEREPGTNVRVLTQRALEAVHGVDLNPYAVAIARCRLVISALSVCGIGRLKESPGWELNVAAGDSLLHGLRFGRDGQPIGNQLWIGSESEGSWAPEVYALEEPGEVGRILGRQYHVVVGNPPYITVKDKAVSNAYRNRYSTCYRAYSLVVPFTERFFDLALGAFDGRDAGGHVGMIASNSFMTHQFGIRLVEDFFPKIELTHLIDSAGAYIPGHGTPTLILFGRNRRPSASAVRVAQGIHGEPGTPIEPSRGKVWLSIQENIDSPGFQNLYVSVVDIPREKFASHPWTLGGGGSTTLKDRLEEVATGRISDLAESIGFYQDTHADEAFVLPHQFVKRHQLQAYFRPHVRGEGVRDWLIYWDESILFPYGESLELWRDLPGGSKMAWFHCLKPVLWSRRAFSGLTYKAERRPWFEYHQFPKKRASSRRFVSFAAVSTHNHFVSDESDKVFNRSAPIIEIGTRITEEQEGGLLAILNSSVGCFWLKQISHNKGSTVDERGARQRTTPFEDFYGYSCKAVGMFPLPPEMPCEHTGGLRSLAERLASCSPKSIVGHGVRTRDSLSQGADMATRTLWEMVGLQEEVGWRCYQLYGLLDERENVRLENNNPPGIKPGERAFEIAMARRMARGELKTTWFERHRSTPINEVPAHWPEDYREVVQRRIDLIESDNFIKLIERPEYKRRWNTEPWEQQQERALREWLLDRLETEAFWPRTGDPELVSCAQLAQKAGRDKDFLQVAEIYTGRADFDLAALVHDLVEAESVPFLPVLRYKPTGLRKREVWERTWELQKQEDEGQDVGDIPVPPRYQSADFLSSSCWKLRGKLDVPKERFISYPHCERSGDSSLVVTWAGYDHLQQAKALSAYYVRMKESEGWEPERLRPLLVGLDQLLFWLDLWHNELDADTGLRMGDFFRDFVREEAQTLGMTMDDIRAWEPTKKVAAKRRKRRKKEE